MGKAVAIVGGGILGRLTALALAERGCQVSLFERGSELGEASCAHAAAGMLAPFCELDSAEPQMGELGVASLTLWPDLIARLRDLVPERTVYFRQNGSLVIAAPRDTGELWRMRRHIAAQLSDNPPVQSLDAVTIKALEPELEDRFLHALFFPNEGHIDPRDVLLVSATALVRLGVKCHFGTNVTRIDRNHVWLGDDRLHYPLVVDCRGLLAREDLQGLRGVRGETIHLHAPAVRLNLPVRLLHPRFPVYIVPRPNHRFLVGATNLETDDMRPITVRSALELLSAAYTVHPGFGESAIIETAVQCRPAFSDNLPGILVDEGLIRANGLYRHGILLSPLVASTIAALALGETLSQTASCLIRSEASCKQTVCI